MDETINKLTEKYLSESVLVDFGKRNLEKRELCAGYVDLSEKDDIKEALFNLYDVLHQLNNLDVKNIIFINLYSNNTGLFITLLDKIERCCDYKKIMIPICYS